MNLRGVLVVAVAGASALAAWASSACSSDGGSTNAGGSSGTSSTGSSSSGASSNSGSGSSTSSGGDGGDAGAGACASDPLRTGLTAVQTGVSVDAFDCEILKWTAKYGEPDAMIAKAIIYVESRFDNTAVACPNLPCGTPSGWTAAESGCFGLMQIVPACGGDTVKAGLLPDGHPNLTKDSSASTWAGSVFNADVNIGIGLAGIADNRAQVKKQFSGCTEDQYTLMAIGNYNSYGSTKSCTQYNTAYDDTVLTAYRQYATAAGYPAHAY